MDDQSGRPAIAPQTKRGVALRYFEKFVDKFELLSRDLQRFIAELGRIAPIVGNTRKEWKEAVPDLGGKRGKHDSAPVGSRARTLARWIVPFVTVVGSGVGSAALAIKRQGPTAQQVVAYEVSQATEAEQQAKQAEVEAEKLRPSLDAEAKGNLLLAQAESEVQAAADAESAAEDRGLQIGRMNEELAYLREEVDRLTAMLRTASAADAVVHLRDIAQMQHDIQGLLRDMAPLRVLEKEHRDEAVRHSALANNLRAQADQVYPPEARAAASEANRLRSVANTLTSTVGQLRQKVMH